MRPPKLRSAPRRPAWALALVLVAACRPSADPTAAPAAPTSAPRVAALEFLVGTWVADTPEGRVTERWAIEGDALVGRSETVADGAQQFFEELRIAAKNGTLVYFAAPMGRTPPTEFRRTDDGTAPGVVVFENPAHDFPKRIRYARNGDRLTATIDGDGKGATWEYVRADR